MFSFLLPKIVPWRLVSLALLQVLVLATTSVLQATVSGPVGPLWPAEKNGLRDPMTALGTPPTPVLETRACMVHLQSYAVVPAQCKSSASSRWHRLQAAQAVSRSSDGSCSTMVMMMMLGQAAAQWHGGQTGDLCVLVSILEARYSSTSQTSRDDHVVTSNSGGGIWL
jgi:hypothetical protein